MIATITNQGHLTSPLQPAAAIVGFGFHVFIILVAGQSSTATNKYKQFLR